MNTEYLKKEDEIDKEKLEFRISCKNKKKNNE